jgi:uncharacterized protein
MKKGTTLKITKLILIFTIYFSAFILSPATNAANSANSKVSANLTTKTKTTKLPPQKTKLKANEYSLAYDNVTKIFSVKLYEGLLLSENCFKKAKPNCEALTASLIKPAANPSENLKSPFHNNFGANHCGLIGGKGMIAKDYQNNETDFCEFKDGSRVSSWSAYYKVNQNK